MTTSSPNPYKGYRFPTEIISHCVWLYYAIVKNSANDFKIGKRLLG